MSKSTKLVIWMAVIGVAVVAPVAWCFVLDTNISRRLTSWRIARIVSQAKAHPQDSRFAMQLVSMAKRSSGFKACVATSALGRLGEAARPVILEIAALMESPDLCVSQAAAKALERLGPLSEPALPQLKAQVSKVPSDATTWFAVQAIGEIGRPAVDCLPLLRQKLGSEPKMFQGTVMRTIDRLEKAE